MQSKKLFHMLIRLLLMLYVVTLFFGVVCLGEQDQQPPQTYTREMQSVLRESPLNDPCSTYRNSLRVQSDPNARVASTPVSLSLQQYLAKRCGINLEAGFGQSNAISEGNGFIYPGTKWCGLGDIAHHSDDLGKFYNTDKCCRDHDKCVDTLKPGKCKHGLCNNSPFTRSNCWCDEKFRQCLLEARDPASLPVGKIFFDIAAIGCFRFVPTGNAVGQPGRWIFERARPFILSAMSREKLAADHYIKPLWLALLELKRFVLP